jgi:hypothetical protein
MTFTLTGINVQHLKKIAYGAVYVLVVTLCLFIAIEAITMQTLNTTLLEALTLLLPLV